MMGWKGLRKYVMSFIRSRYSGYYVEGLGTTTTQVMIVFNT